MVAIPLKLFPDDAPASEPTAPFLASVRAQRGDLWQLGKHRLLCGNATCAEDVARLMGNERALFLFADPPYGMEIEPRYCDIILRRWEQATGQTAILLERHEVAV